MHYGPNDFERKIRIDIASDFCHEDYSEYIKVQLFIPGGPALIGELYNTVVRIDDDDYVHLNNGKFFYHWFFRIFFINYFYFH